MSDIYISENLIKTRYKKEREKKVGYLADGGAEGQTGTSEETLGFAVVRSNYPP